MPVHNCRRSFLRGGLALVVTSWISACGTRTTSTPTPFGTALPVSTALPASATAMASPNPIATAGLPSDLAPTTTPPLSAYPQPPAPEPYLPPATAPTAIPAAQFSGAKALEHAATQVQWVPRDTGSEGWTKCGDYIATQFEAAGWMVENQRFDYKDINCRNIIAKRGSGPGVIIGAHYDARRRADRDPDPAKQQDPVPAANDGASGVAVLLELARVLNPETLGCEVWLAAFDAEDNGELDGWDWIVGSKNVANTLPITPEAVIVVDMVGDASQQLYYEQTSDKGIREGVWQVANTIGFSTFVAEERYAVLDDHTPFLQRGLRAIDIIDFDYPYWHTTQDTLDKISAASLESVGKTLEEWLLRGRPGV